jgi:hypothetical protein
VWRVVFFAGLPGDSAIDACGLGAKRAESGKFMSGQLASAVRAEVTAHKLVKVPEVVITAELMARLREAMFKGVRDDSSGTVRAEVSYRRNDQFIIEHGSSAVASTQLGSSAQVRSLKVSDLHQSVEVKFNQADAGAVVTVITWGEYAAERAEELAETLKEVIEASAHPFWLIHRYYTPLMALHSVLDLVAIWVVGGAWVFVTMALTTAHFALMMWAYVAFPPALYGGNKVTRRLMVWKGMYAGYWALALLVLGAAIAYFLPH